ncbi:MAG: M50 family metallopeptidase [Planctomycetaceae bacterium]
MYHFYQILLISTFLPFSWLTFMIVHEFGHVSAAWLTGGHVEYVVLHPLSISMTVLSENPHPQLVAWGGPIIGSILPLLAYVMARLIRSPGLYLFRYFCGFCLVANGLYILVDGFTLSGDGMTLLNSGASRWQLILFGLIATPIGFWCWHGEGRHFGFGTANGIVQRTAAIISAFLFFLVLIIEFTLN